MASKSRHGDKPPVNDAAAGRQPRCPICTAPSVAELRPFCSRRCADVDLSRWMRGGYAIPGRVDVDEDGDDVAAASGTARQRPQPEDDEADG